MCLSSRDNMYHYSKSNWQIFHAFPVPGFTASHVADQKVWSAAYAFSQMRYI